MISALVIADDVTGAHASAESLRGPAAPVSVVASATMAREQRELIAGLADVVVCATGTRNASQSRAVEAVLDALRRWWPVTHVAKRIDSTLRGHLGAEVGGLVRELAALSGRQVLALACPAHPAAGRTTLAGRQHLHGIPLDTSAGSQATIEPLDRSRILPLLQTEGRLDGAGVDLATVRSGVGDRLDAALDDALDVVVFDSETLGDLDRLAISAARFAARHPDILVVSVDPGPFTARLHHHLTSAAAGVPAVDGPVLAVVGSASDLTRRQLRRLIGHRPTRPVTVVDVASSGRGGLRPVDDVVRELTAAAETAPSGTVLLLTTVTSADGRDGHLDPALSRLVPAMVGDVVRRFLETRPVSGLLLTGGDVANGVLAGLGAIGVRPTLEIEPLAVRGVVVGGRWSGLPLATKGGLVGDDETLVRCIDQLTVRGSPEHAPARPASLT